MISMSMQEIRETWKDVAIVFRIFCGVTALVIASSFLDI